MNRVQACHFPKGSSAPDAPQTHLTGNVDGEEDPGQCQHGKYALRRNRQDSASSHVQVPLVSFAP